MQSCSIFSLPVPISWQDSSVPTFLFCSESLKGVWLSKVEHQELNFKLISQDKAHCFSSLSARQMDSPH